MTRTSLVEHPWTRDKLVAEASICIHTKFTRDRLSMTTAGFKPANPAS